MRGKGKKHTVVADLGVGEEEKIPTFKKRGRPQKAAKDNNETNVTNNKLEEQNGEAVKELTEDTKSEASSENGGRKRSLVKDDESIEEEEEESGGGDKVMKTEAVKAVGFRPIGNRRKNTTPRRAAEVGVECQ